MTTIRNATLHDVPKVVALWDQAAGPTRRAGGIDEATQLLTRDPESLLLAVEDGAIVGTLIAGWDGWRCHLYRLAVDVAFRRRGIAVSLLAAAQARAAAVGAFRLDAMVRLDNAPAVALWEAAGYELESADGRYSHWVWPDHLADG